MFDIEKFLNDFNIPIPDKNRNTGIGWINIQCPFCNDKRNHLGYNYEKNYWHCWKCDNNGYHKTIDVIKALLPYEDEKKIYNKYNLENKLSNLIYSKLNSSYKLDIKTKTSLKLVLPGEELKIKHRNYLIDRGFDPDLLIKKYKIKGTLNIGNYKNRIIIPIYYKKRLVTFQTRAIDNSIPRYINCNPEYEKISIKDILYNVDNCKKNYCIITEGVFKVFKLGNSSLATLGKNYTKKQLSLLSSFNVVFIYFDPDKYGQNKAKNLSMELDNLGVKTFNIVHKKAPDDLNKKEIKIIKIKIKKILKKLNYDY